jgi:hypothetical protein
VVALHQGGQSIEKNFRPIQRIHVQLSLVIGDLVVRIKDNRGNVTAVPFRANTPAIVEGDGVSNYDRAHMAVTKNLESRVN